MSQPADETLRPVTGALNDLVDIVFIRRQRLPFSVFLDAWICLLFSLFLLHLLDLMGLTN